MNNAIQKSSRLVTVLRWLARVLGILSVVVFMVFFVADCVKKGTIAIGNDRISMTVFMFVTFIGLIMAWKWEGIGGSLALLSLIPFNVFAPASLAQPAVLFMTLMYGLPAVLFLVCWWLTKRQQYRSIAANGS